MLDLSWWLPPNVSTYGASIDRHFLIIYWLTGGVFILVALAMLYFLVKYRDRGDGRRAVYSHGNNTLEVIWTVIPAVIFLLLGVMGASTWAHVKINPPPAEMTVGLHGKQFNWFFTYPGPDGQFGSKDDYKQENLLRVPVNKVVHLKLTSEDVIHSFFVPQLRLKQDLLPGRELIAWFEATKPGKYGIPCAELCGFGHTTMVGQLQVLSQEEFDAWSAKRWPQALPAPAERLDATPAASPAEPVPAMPSPATATP